MRIIETMKGALRRIVAASGALATLTENRLVASRAWLVACAFCLAVGAALGHWVR